VVGERDWRFAFKFGASTRCMLVLLTRLGVVFFVCGGFAVDFTALWFIVYCIVAFDSG